MKAEQLKKFVTDNNIEYHYRPKKGEVWMMVYYNQVAEFHKILDPSIYDEITPYCFMQDGYFFFPMLEICQYYGLVIEDCFDTSGKDGN